MSNFNSHPGRAGGIPNGNYPVIIQGAGAESAILDGTLLTAKDYGILAMENYEMYRLGVTRDNNAHITIKGLTFRNAPYAYEGGGLTIWTGTANITIENCVFLNNVSDSYGGGGAYLSTSNGNVTLTQNAFLGNSGYETGGGLYLQTYQSATLTNNSFVGNTSGSDGGGAYIEGKDITLTDNTFENNISSDGEYGGGVYLEAYSLPSSTANLTFTGNVVRGNSIPNGYGGGAYVYATGSGTEIVTMAKNRVTGNSSYYDAAGAYVEAGGAAVLMSNNVFGLNRITGAGVGYGYDGGGVYIYYQEVFLTNNTVAGNTATGSGGGLLLYPAQAGAVGNIYNNIIWGNTAPQNGSDIYVNDWYGAPINLYTNTYTVYANRCDATPGCSYAFDYYSNSDLDPRLTFDYHLQPGSPCIDGAFANPPGGLPPDDIDGQARPVDGNNDGLALADRGADEYYGRLVNLTGLFDSNKDGITEAAAFHHPTDQFFADYAGNMGQYGWGGADCMPVVWDFDGDGRTDVSIYHIPTNQWFVRGFSEDNLGQYGFGQDESIPVPGDYNGDGLMERAFYHWPTNRWFIEGRDPIEFGWGGADCVPFAGDYDGDGTTDMMLYHIPSNQWFVHGIGNLGQFGWGGADCIPVPGDWNGDGRTEVAVYYAPDSEWIWREEGGTAHFMGQFGWGGTESFPIPGDYNGDGTMERGFYRYAQNWWFLEGEPDFYWGWGGQEFMPITSQMAVYNWFRFVLGRFQ